MQAPLDPSGDAITGPSWARVPPCQAEEELYGIRTGGIMDRFSNAAVEVRVERFFRVVASPEAKRDTGPETSLGEVGLIDNEQWAYGK
jgi:hypothetical protein